MNMEFDNYDEQLPKRYSLQDALQALPLPPSGVVPPQVILGLSDLDIQELPSLRSAWNKLSDKDRGLILERLTDSSDTDYMLDYSAVAYLGYDDPAPEVRLAALRLGTMDTTGDRMYKLIDMAQHDPQEFVRAEAIGQLGQFIYLGEVDELEGLSMQPVVDLALHLWHDRQESLEVRRRALESLGHSSMEGIDAIIDQAYADPSDMMKLSAVVAMGHSCDETWAQNVISELESDDPAMVEAAIVAAGTIVVPEAVALLANLIYSDDTDIQMTAIWALGEIGGDEATEALEGLALQAEEEGDEDLYEAIEEALATSSMITMMMDFEPGYDDGDLDPDFDDGFGDEDDEDEHPRR